MKNSNMPAMPIEDNEQSFPLDMERYGSDSMYKQFAAGMTKREMMAMHLMAAMISAPLEKFNMNTAAKTASCAVESADALLCALDITCQKS